MTKAKKTEKKSKQVKKAKLFMIRQGDVLVKRVDAIPDGLKKRERAKRGAVLAEGEVTGHSHHILEQKVELFEDQTGDPAFLKVLDQSAKLLHDEHSAHTLAPGAYKVVRQVEWINQQIAHVTD